MNETKYYIFGKLAVEAFFYSDNKTVKDILEKRKGELAILPPGESPSKIMRKLLGWEDFTEISWNDYKQLKTKQDEN